MASIAHNTVIIKIPNKSTSVKTFLPESKITVVGMKGIQGTEGKSAFEIAVESGFTGTKLEWLASLKGEAFKYTDFTNEQLQALKGEKGAPGKEGHTPVRGVDYFTEADIAAMVDAVATRFVDGDKEVY